MCEWIQRQWVLWLFWPKLWTLSLPKKSGSMGCMCYVYWSGCQSDNSSIHSIRCKKEKVNATLYGTSCAFKHFWGCLITIKIECFLIVGMAYTKIGTPPRYSFCILPYVISFIVPSICRFMRMFTSDMNGVLANGGVLDLLYWHSYFRMRIGWHWHWLHLVELCRFSFQISCYVLAQKEMLVLS